MDVVVFRDGVLVNVIRCDSLAEAQAAYPGCLCLERTAETAPPVPRIVSRYAFRERLTNAEKVAFDNGPSNPLFAVEVRAQLVSLAEDFRQASNVDLDDPKVAAGLDFLALVGILAEGRAAEILA